jgi:hypothetical protein
MDILPFNHLLYKKESKITRDILKSYHMELNFNSITNCLEKTHPEIDLTSSDFQLNESAFSNCFRKFYNLIDKK